MRVWNAGWLALIVAGLGIAGCSFGGSANGSYAPMRAQRISSGNSSPIKHVVVVIQENRTFDNLFATFPGADGTTTGEAEAVPVAEQSQCPIDRKEKVNLTQGNLAVGDDFGHKYSDVQIDYENGNMDGFDVDPIPAGGGKIACLHPYQYVNPSQISPYWDIAQQYVLADHMYQTQGSGSFTAHQDLIAGGTAIDSHESIIDDPSGFPWGCDSPSTATTSLSLRPTANTSPVKDRFPVLRSTRRCGIGSTPPKFRGSTIRRRWCLRRTAIPPASGTRSTQSRRSGIAQSGGRRSLSTTS
jgi:phospholipase C